MVIFWKKGENKILDVLTSKQFFSFNSSNHITKYIKNIYYDNERRIREEFDCKFIKTNLPLKEILNKNIKDIEKYELKNLQKYR